MCVIFLGLNIKPSLRKQIQKRLKVDADYVDAVAEVTKEYNEV